MSECMPSELHPRIEMVYDADCPNIARARTAIREALTMIGAPADWHEWNRDDPATPSELRRLGSPSIVVDGRDVGAVDGALATADANSCRVYVDGCGCLTGAPSVELILKAIAAGRQSASVKGGH